VCVGKFDVRVCLFANIIFFAAQYKKNLLPLSSVFIGCVALFYDYTVNLM
jgi:hypothetical protein